MPQKWEICICYLSQIDQNVKKKLEVHMSNKGAQNVPTGGTASPQRGAKTPPKGKICVSRPPYLTHSDQNYSNVSIHSTTYAAHYVPQLRLLPPFWGHKPPEKGEICASRPPYLSHSNRFIVPLMPHNIPPQLEPLPPFGA